MKAKYVVNSEYTFVKCLGEGMSSTVYEAIRSNLSGIADEKVAVKVLKSENSVSWLQSEFESLKRVNSKNCVRVLGYEAFAEGPALILEFIDGVTLLELGTKFQLSQVEIAELASQISKGLCDIASFGLSHGDINPKNILITQEGLVKLIDFGSFRDFDETVGSIPYIASQVWEHAKPTLQTDLKSLQLILIDLKTRFTDLPTSKETAKARADNIEGISFEPATTNLEVCKTLGKKVQLLISQRECAIQTTVLSRKTERRVIKWRWAAALTLALLLPAQSLLSGPLKQADPAILLIRTSAWTQISINGESKGYSPVSLHGLKPGLYKISFDRQRGGGELAVFLNPGQKRLLIDTDFD